MSDCMDARLYLRAKDFLKLSEESQTDLLSSGCADVRDIEAANPDDVWEFIGNDCRYGEFGDIEEELVEKGIPFDRWSDDGGYCDYNRRTRYYRPGQNGKPDIDETHDDGECTISPRELEEAIADLLDCPAKQRIQHMIAWAVLAHIPPLQTC